MFRFRWENIPHSGDPKERLKREYYGGVRENVRKFRREALDSKNLLSKYRPEVALSLSGKLKEPNKRDISFELSPNLWSTLYTREHTCSTTSGWNMRCLTPDLYLQNHGTKDKLGQASSSSGVRFQKRLLTCFERIHEAHGCLQKNNFGDRIYWKLMKWYDTYECHSVEKTMLLISRLRLWVSC